MRDWLGPIALGVSASIFSIWIGWWCVAFIVPFTIGYFDSEISA